MRLSISTSFVVGVALVICWLAGCASRQPAYNVIDIEAEYDIVYSYRYKQLVVVTPNMEHAPLVQSTTCMIHPRFSPDGERIAWLDVGTASLPVSTTQVAAHIADVENTVQNSYDVIVVPLPAIDLDNKLMVQDAVPIVWTHDGNFVLVAHAAGIDRVSASGDRSTLIELKGIKTLALSPTDDLLVFSTSQNVYALQLNGGQAEPLLEGDFVPSFGNRQIRAVTFAPGGHRVMFALMNEFFVIDIQSGDVTKVFEESHAVYWLAWLPASDEVIYLAGRERRRSPTYGARYREREGEYRLAVITTDGSYQRELFRGHLMDVREAVPSLSPDARYVSITSRPYPMEVYIVATDGSGVSPLTIDGPNSYSTWRPGAGR